MSLIKSLFGSKKFVVLLLGVAGTAAVTYFGVDPGLVDKLKDLVMAYILGQGVADAGKFFSKK